MVHIKTHRIPAGALRPIPNPMSFCVYHSLLPRYMHFRALKPLKKCFTLWDPGPSIMVDMAVRRTKRARQPNSSAICSVDGKVLPFQVGQSSVGPMDPANRGLYVAAGATIPSGAIYEDSKSQYVYPYLGKALLGGRLISRQPNFYKMKTQRIWNWGAAPSSKPLSFHFVEIGLMR